MGARTYDAEQFAELLGVSSWALYESVRRGDCPLAPIKIGRRLVWPRVAVDRLLGLNDEGPGTTPGLASTTSIALEDDNVQRTG